MTTRAPLLVAAAATIALTLGACRPAEDPLDTAPDVAAAIEASREAHPDAWKRKVILLGFDSCDPDLVEEMIRAGKLPNFARMHREGAHGELRSLTPLLSPVIWTTVATGMSPERHGILDFVTDTPEGKRPVSSNMRQADTMWELVSSAGGSVGVVGWLVSWPASEVNGFMVTDKVGRLAYEADRFGGGSETEPQAVYPAEVIDVIRDERVTIDNVPLGRVRSFVDVTEEEWADAYTTTYKDRDNMLGTLRLIQADAETFRAVGERLYREERPRLFASYFNAMDALSHYFMPFATPKMQHIPEDDYLKYRGVIEATYMWHDAVLGEYMALADEDTTVIVVSDHGFKHGELRTPDSSRFEARTGAAWHRRYGVIAMWGGGVRPGHRITGATVWDIAPTVLAGLGYPVPDDMHGNVLDDVFEDGLPHETVETWFGEQRREEVAARQADDSALSESGMTPEEQEELQRLIELGYTGGAKRDPVSTTINLVSRLLAVRRYERAIDELEKIIVAQGVNGDPRAHLTLTRAHILYAEALQASGRGEEAEEHFTAAATTLRDAERMVRDDIGPLLLRARLARARGDLANAEGWSRRAVELKPYEAAVHNELGEVLFARADAAKEAGDDAARRQYEEQALDAYETSLRREPRQFYAHLRAALLLLSSMPTRGTPREAIVEHIGTNAAKALDHLDEAVELVTKSPQAHNNRAIAQLRLGNIALVSNRRPEGVERLEDALQSAETALGIQPEYAIGWANKAYVLWKLERLADARDAALEARKIDSSYSFDPKFVMALALHGTPIDPPEPKPDTEPE